MKHRIVHTLQKYLLNPPIKLLFAMGLAPPGYALLETTDRTTAKARWYSSWRRGASVITSGSWPEYGMNAGYVRNLVRHPRVRLKLRDGILARWHIGTAHVFSDDDPRKRQRWLAWSVTQKHSECSCRATIRDRLAHGAD